MTEEKKKRLTVGEKATIITRLLDGERASRLAIEYGVSQPAISRMKKNKENILASKRNLDEQQGGLAKKKCTGIENSILEKGLYRWYVQRRSLGHTVSGSMLQEKALLYNTITAGSSDFKASNGWLNKFKKRHSIREFTVQTTRSAFDEPSSKEFADVFAEFVTTNGINPDHIYSADETSLLWKMVPNKTVVAELERDMAGRRIHEDRVTVMVCSNASGTHKLPLLVIGDEKKPRCFNELESVVYENKKNAWMDRDLFTEWYTEIFIPALRKKHGCDAKCILLIDNAPPHPRAEFLNGLSTICTVSFLSPTVTSHIQPIHEVVGNMKSIYKKNLLTNIVLHKDLEKIIKYLKTLNIAECCYALARSWESVTDISIKNSWKNILQIPEIAWYDNHFLEPYTLYQLVKQLPNGAETTTEETRKWLEDEEADSGWRELSDVEILLGTKEEPDEPIVHTVESDEDDYSISAEEALQGIETFKRWYQSRSECSKEHLVSLLKFRDVAAQEVVSMKLKLELTDPLE